MNNGYPEKALHYIALAINTRRANQAQVYEDIAYEYAVRAGGAGLLELDGLESRPRNSGFGTDRSGRRMQRYHVLNGRFVPPWALGAGDLVQGV